MNVKIVICDIDNTLVVKHQVLTPRAKKAIEILRDHGVLFGIASGRPLDELKVVDSWEITNDIIIAFNGCKLVDNVDHKIYSYHPMKKEWIKETLDIMAPFNCNPLVAFDGYTLIGHYDEMCELSQKFTGKSCIVVDDFSQLYENDNYKIMYRVNEEDMPAIEAHVAAHPSPYFKGFKTGIMMMEFANIKASKGYALEQFCRMHDIDIKDVWAFGDTTNDNEMLQTAGVGVCMKNGSEDTKAVADVITEKTCDEDGWADFIENHILIPNGWMER